MKTSDEKINRYDWAKAGDKGRAFDIPIDQLKIDHSYQRLEVSETNTLSIARAFNWISFGSIIVMKRDNGEMYVVDGQQRLLAARRRGDIKSVPCRVFLSDGPHHEAKAFVSLNVNRRAVRAVAKYMANVMAGVNPDKEISDWLKSMGFVVSDHATSKYGIDFPAVLIQTWKLNVEASKAAIKIQKGIVGEEPMRSDIHKGLFLLKHKGIEIENHIDKIILSGGKTALVKNIRQVCIEASSAASQIMCARGILNVVNNKRRNRIILPMSN